MCMFLVALTPKHFLYLQITGFKMTGELRYVGEKKKNKNKLQIYLMQYEWLFVKAQPA